MAIGKRSGKKSQGSNDFLMPRTPTIGTATNVGTGRAFNNGAATVTFTADPTYAADSFTVTSTPGSFTGTGASSPITVTGLQSDTAYTFKVTATNTYGTSGESAASDSITATTVPATPAAPTASSPNADADVVSWTAPANGGSAITNYYWESNDSKSGNTATTPSVTVAQEAGTAQRYKVRATNANGNSEFSALSNEITTTFSFVPFGVFGFSPFQVFGFSPFSVFGFSPFQVFGFSPFRVFGFSPFRVFGFSPACIDEDTPILTKSGIKKASEIKVGDILLTKTFDEMPLGGNYKVALWFGKGTLKNYKVIESTVESITKQEVHETVIFNNDYNIRFSMMEDIFVIKDGVYKFVPSREIKPGDKVITYDSIMTIESVEVIDELRTVYDFHRNPLGLISANNVLCYNAYPILTDN
jgi:hypothetical protein